MASASGSAAIGVVAAGTGYDPSITRAGNLDIATRRTASITRRTGRATT